VFTKESAKAQATINESLAIDTQPAWPKKPFHWFKFCAGDIVKGTLHMKADEFGAHVLLLIHYWEHGKLPDTDDDCAFVARMDRKRWRSTREKILARVAAECSQHTRRAPADDESARLHIATQRADMLTLSEKRAEYGRTGGRPRVAHLVAPAVS
jgi:Protein of unknown function (DUF1376)